MAELIVVTGGSYAGKTAAIRELAARGHDVLPEAAYEVIDELNRIHGVEGQIGWRERNPIGFQRLISERQHGREQAARRAESRYVFCDRGLLDGQAYCRMAGVTWPDDLRALAAPARYAHVFVFATLSGFERREETGRIESAEASARTAALLEEIYRPQARGVTNVAEAPVAERVETMLRRLQVQRS